jgi:DNA-binding NarL/FixJ family response regulator
MPEALLPMIAAALSPRQRQVARLLLCGASGKEIGQALGISEDTVKQHCESMCHKAGIYPSNRATLVIALLAKA